MGYKLDRTLGNNAAWQAKHLDRVLNMYHILSLGNEAGNGVNFYEAYRVLKALERDGQNRPVCYERAEREWNTDMLVPQYPGADWFARMGERESGRPVVPSEYAHAMGNSTGSLDLQWNQIYAHTHLQGGFIWDWVDQGLYDEEKGWTYGGDYGVDAPSDANFLCNGLVNPDRNPHPGYYEVKHVYQDIAITGVAPEEGRFAIQNRFYFKDLSDYSVRWRLERDGKPVRKGKLSFSTPAQSSEEFTLQIPKRKLRKRGEYRIFFETETAHALPLLAKGTVVAADEVLIKDTGTTAETYGRTSSYHHAANPLAVSDDGYLYVTANNSTEPSVMYFRSTDYNHAEQRPVPSPDSGTKASSAAGSPKTGDSLPAAALGVVLAFALAGLATALTVRRSRSARGNSK